MLGAAIVFFFKEVKKGIMDENIGVEMLLIKYSKKK